MISHLLAALAWTYVGASFVALLALVVMVGGCATYNPTKPAVEWRSR